jgi:hypothetical protein
MVEGKISALSASISTDASYPYHPGVTKRCRLSWLTNTALVYKPKCVGRGSVAGSQPMSTAVRMEPKFAKFVSIKKRSISHSSVCCLFYVVDVFFPKNPGPSCTEICEK